MSKKFKLPTAKCLRCEYTWTPRQDEPSVCPRCKSPYWNREKIMRTKDKN